MQEANMATIQRFQILSSARQDLFRPESPVWVSRCQLSLDLESGKRLLQTRMVNCSERTVRQVFLRIVCLGADRERLSQLELVPMEAVSVRPGRVFGDDKLVEVPVRGTVYTEVYAQRVRFSDGTAWDEAEAGGYLAFKAEPVDPEDPHYETLVSRARSGGVRNDCYFRAQQGLWVCTCGLPNAVRNLHCVRCGADRLWLEQHMDPNLIDAPAPVREPEPAPAPAPAPVPIVTVTPAPIRDYPPAQPTIIVQPAPEPPVVEAPPSHAGRTVAILLAILLFLGVGGYCAYRVLTPLLRYQEALREQAAGNYDSAKAIFEELGEYRDSPAQIQETLIRKALSMMGEGKYQQAMELFETLEGQEGHVADCLYSLGVLAFNDKDVDAAMTYVTRLRERFPDYSKTEQLAQYCNYSLGNRAAAEAAELDDPDAQIAAYETALAYFGQTGGYEDSADRAKECEYRIAVAIHNKGETEEAIRRFTALGDYQNSQELLKDCKFAYASAHIENADQLTFDYLEELAAANYLEAQDLLDRLNGVGFTFRITLGAMDNPGTLVEVGDLSNVYIHYTVEHRDEAGAVLVLVLYKLPDGREGRALLNNDRSARGARGWADIPFPTNCVKSGPVTLTFYDSMRGEGSEPLDTMTFQYKYTAPAQDGSTGG
jgi:tetratricopeptide (TPR) repeat protein